MNFPQLKGEQIVNWSRIFSVLLASAVIALGGVLSQFEIIPHPEDGFVYEWQLAEPMA